MQQFDLQNFEITNEKPLEPGNFSIHSVNANHAENLSVVSVAINNQPHAFQVIL